MSELIDNLSGADEPLLDDLLDNAVDPLQDDLSTARIVVARAVEAVKVDPTAYLQMKVIDALRSIRQNDPLEYETARTQLKLANRLIRMEALDSFTSIEEGGGSHTSAATALTELASSRCELWHDADGNGFASLEREVDGVTHREHWRLESTGFREWMAWLTHTELGDAPSSETLKSASNALAGKAKFDGQEHKPALRVAKTEAGYWLDVGDEKWRAILITATGWTVVDKPPVRFIRTKAMRPLVMPSATGNLDLLWGLVNIPESDRDLVLAWLLECLRPDTPYPVMELIGEQGSAKSTTQRTLRMFVDTNKVMLRGRPKGVEDVFVAAGSNHIISLENLSGISPELSDALCTISTGGGQAGRLLFTNGEEHVVEAHNPVMLNGIGAVVTRPDLLDRTVAICLPTITERANEVELENALERDAPAIMGGLLDLFAKSLLLLPDVDIPPSQRPRMADFAYLGEAMARALGRKPGQWLAQYVEHRQDAIRRTIDSSPVALACIEFVQSGNRHASTVKSLLALFNDRNAASHIERSDYWPRSPKGLGDALRRAAPALRQIGIHLTIETKARRDGIHCELRSDESHTFRQGLNIEEPSSPCSPCSQREVVRL